jgi:hypothetical protein
MRSKHSSFVVTVSALAACTPTRPAPTTAPETSTAPTTTSVEVPEPVAETDAATEVPSAVPDAGSELPPATLAAHPIPVNPRDANDRVIKKAWDGNGCFVELPFPPLLPGQQRPPGTPPPRQKVTCPTTMNDPAYDACKGGVLYTTETRSSCVCFVMGNPPPPPRREACPK